MGRGGARCPPHTVYYFRRLTASRVGTSHLPHERFATNDSRVHSGSRAVLPALRSCAPSPVHESRLPTLFLPRYGPLHVTLHQMRKQVTPSVPDK